VLPPGLNVVGGSVEGLDEAAGERREVVVGADLKGVEADVAELEKTTSLGRATELPPDEDAL
jgi:hypothetical protein